MIIREIKKNLFDMDNSVYYYAHCISSCCSVPWKGIASNFERIFNLRHILLTKYSIVERRHPNTILEGNVFNLITKEFYYHKPSYDDLYISLLILRSICIENKIKKLAIPKIGCGMDKLSWRKVKKIIESIFQYINIEIIICIYK